VYVISTRKLTRRFGEIVAVRDLDLEIAPGGVVGLVGPNGSGKSTLIRLLLGLIRPSSGEASVFGRPISRPQAYASRVGALIESPAFIPALSARANLRSLAQLRAVPGKRVDEVLDTVGLLGRAKEPAKQFSLGMKQRLGIAAALLPDPELLVLDEPTNGLDPAGIVEIRGLLRRLGDEGRTVVVSSHLLSEIEAACDTLAVIRYGELLYSGPLADLVAQAGEAIEVVPEFPGDLDRLGRLLADRGWTAVVRDADVHLSAQAALAPDVNRLAAAAGITLRELRPHEASLEEVFLRLTGSASGDHGEAAASDPPASQKVEVPS
jgi:ABC-2 type transport system ATP-binding protein